MNPLRVVFSAFVLPVFLLPAVTRGQAAGATYQPPTGIHFENRAIVSEGTRMAAELFSLQSLDGKKLPTIIMCHGWGGEAKDLRSDAVAFARAGYFVVTFDYRGWGASDARLVLTGPAPSRQHGQPFTAAVKEVREVVDPLDQTTDLQNVIHWVQGEPLCDVDHIGLWGSSYSGGHVVYAAARDARIKAIVSQVPALDSRWVVATGVARQQTFGEATARARGERGYPKPGERVIMGLRVRRSANE